MVIKNCVHVVLFTYMHIITLYTLLPKAAICVHICHKDICRPPHTCTQLPCVSMLTLEKSFRTIVPGRMRSSDGTKQKMAAEEQEKENRKPVIKMSAIK